MFGHLKLCQRYLLPLQSEPWFWLIINVQILAQPSAHRDPGPVLLVRIHPGAAVGFNGRSGAANHGVDWSERLWEIHVAGLPEPDE